MDDFLLKIGDKVLSEMGIAVAFLCIAIWWLARELGRERAERIALQESRTVSFEKQTEASLATSAVLVELKNAIERLSERVR